MISLQNDKAAILLNPTSATAAATITSSQVDCLGADAVSLTVIATTADAASNSPTVFKVQESDTTDATNFGDITALVGNGTGGFTIPAANTATSLLPYAKLTINRLNGARKRYIRMLISPATTQTYTVVAALARLDQMPITAANANVSVVANG